MESESKNSSIWNSLKINKSDSLKMMRFNLSQNKYDFHNLPHHIFMEAFQLLYCCTKALIMREFLQRRFQPDWQLLKIFSFFTAIAKLKNRCVFIALQSFQHSYLD